ncbi:hypothetical protein CFIICLFH_2311 [Methylobacterium goesingense]|nr:hypothetical protein CFIICLFH_2311 [Methylobacterium goesingense]
MVLARIPDVVPLGPAPDHRRPRRRQDRHVRQHAPHGGQHGGGVPGLPLGQGLGFGARVAEVALVVELLGEARGLLRIPAEALGAAPGQGVLGEQARGRAALVALLHRQGPRPGRGGGPDHLRRLPLEDPVLGHVPQGQGGPLGRLEVQRDLEEVLRHERPDALFEVGQDGERRRLHAAEAPGLAEGGRTQLERDGAGTVEAEVIILVLAAEGLQVGGVVARAGIRLPCQGREGAPDRDVVEGAEFQAVDAPAPAEMLQHLPGDHRALAPRIGGDDHALDAPQRLTDRRELTRMRLARAARAAAHRNGVDHDGEGLEVPGLPFGPDLTGLLGGEEVPLGGDANGIGRAEEALELAHRRRFLEEEQRAASPRGHHGGGRHVRRPARGLRSRPARREQSRAMLLSCAARSQPRRTSSCFVLI